MNFRIAWLAVATLVSAPGLALADRPSRLGGLIDRVGPPPAVYEVSKGGADKKKLHDVFSRVQRANGGELTQEDFIQRLKAREHFEIRYPEKCRTCKGWGRITPERGPRGKDGKVRCPRCRQSGKELRPLLVVWKAGVPTHKGDKRPKEIVELQTLIGKDASAILWGQAAKLYHTGSRSGTPNARRMAHAAYEKSIAVANETWHHDEPDGSDWNSALRKVIKEGLAGIAKTAPQRPEKPESSSLSDRPGTRSR